MGYGLPVMAKTMGRAVRPGNAMKSSSMLRVMKNCQTCLIHSQGFFCDLPPETFQDLDAISSLVTYSKGELLFVEGQEPRGIFVICSGRVKLSASSAGGRSQVVRVAEAGEVVGLPGAVSGKPYEATAEALEPVQANCVLRGRFLHFMREHRDAGVRVAEMLCHIYEGTYQKVRHLCLYNSAPEKLARFLLDRVTNPPEDNGQSHITLTLTHEQIGEMIGTSRETVTRMFASFKQRKLIEVRGATLLITDKAGLQELLQAGEYTRTPERDRTGRDSLGRVLR